MTSSHFMLTCLLAASYLQYGDCTKCYQCTSAVDPKCGDPMVTDESKAVQCTSDAFKQAADLFNTGAKKVADWGSSLGFNNMQAKPVDANLQCSKVDVTDGDKKVTTIRGCMMPPTSSFDPCKSFMEKLNSDSAKVTFCEICDSDFCNSATSLKITAAFLLPLLALLLSNYN